MKARMREHSVGAELKLLPGDLMICRSFPMSVGVAVNKLVVLNNGEVECGIYRVLPNKGRSFGHAVFSVGKDEIDQIKELLAELANSEEQVSQLEDECDFSIYEEPERRLVRYWNSGCEMASGLPKQQYFLDQGISSEIAEEYSRRFLAVWRAADRVFQHGQNWHGGLIGKE